jgi:hypothetical protein
MLPFSGPGNLVRCHTPLILGCSLIGGDGFLLSQDQPMGTELQFLPNPCSPYIPVFRLTEYSTCLLVGLLDFSSTLKMEALCSSETSVATQVTTRRHIPEDDTLNSN